MLYLDLRRNHVRVEFLLQLPTGVRYRSAQRTSGDIAIRDFDDQDTSLTYTELPLITTISLPDASVDDLGGISKHGQASVTLTSHGFRDVEQPADPVRVLGRLGPQGSSWTGRLQSTLPHSTGIHQIEVDIDPTPLGLNEAPRLLHIGREAVVADASGGTGTSVDPYWIRVVRRGCCGTHIHQHTVLLGQGRAPFITAERVFWGHSPAVLLARPIRTDNTVGDWVEVCAGVLDGEPAIQSAGSQVVVRIVPWTTVLSSWTLGDALPPAGLAQGWHLYRRGRADQIAVAQRWRAGDAIQQTLSADSNAGSQILRADNGAHSALSDLTLEGGHPRRAALKAGGAEAVEPASYQGDGEFNLPAGEPSINLVAGQPLRNEEVAEIAAVPLVPDGDDEAVLRWPAEVWQRASVGMTPNAVTDADALPNAVHGAWANVQFQLQGPALAARLNASQHAGPLQVELGPHLEATGGTPLSIRPEEQVIFPFYQLDDGRDPAGPGAQNLPPLTLEVGVDGQRWARLPLPTPPSAYYQHGEDHLLLDAPVVITAAGHTTLLIEAPGEGGDTARYWVRVISSTPVERDSEVIGHVVELAESDRGRLPSLGDWPGQSPVRVYQVADLSSGERNHSLVLLSLLNSGVGSGVNGLRDILSLGANIPEDRLDVESFQRLPTPAWPWHLRARSGERVADVLGDVLRLWGVALTMRTDRATGRQRLGAIRLGPASASEAIGTAHRHHWVQAPESLSTEQIVNWWVAKLNYDDTGQSTLETRIVEEISVSHYGRMEAAELELKGIDIDPSAGDVEDTLRGWAARMRAQLAWKHRKYKAQLPIHLYWGLQVGDVLLVETDHAIRNSGERGLFAPVTLTAVRATSSLAPGNELALEVEFVYQPQNGTGYAPSLFIEELIDAKTVRVSEHRYAPPTDLISGEPQTDASLFHVGGVVRVFHQGRYASTKVSTTIAAIDLAQSIVTFVDAHGLGGHPEPGIVRIGKWSELTDEQRGRAALASGGDSPRLGGVDAAQTYG